MSKFDKKLQALSLRREGKSMLEIARKLGVSKSSVSLWCRDIKLTSTQKKRLYQIQVQAGHRGRILGAEVNKKRKTENILQAETTAQKMIGTLSERDKLMLGIGLYWGEGTKTYTGAVSLVNSDPTIVLLARDWFESLGVTRDMFRPYIFISELHRQREVELIHYWSGHLEIPVEQFYKVIFIKGQRKKLYENHNMYYGVLALRVRKSAQLKYKILGLIKAVKCRRSSVGRA